MPYGTLLLAGLVGGWLTTTLGWWVPFGVPAAAPALIAAEPPRPAISELPPHEPPHAMPRIRVETEIDLFGNEISDALATYEIDVSGGMYEVHSPETEVPQLKPPSS